MLPLPFRWLRMTLPISTDYRFEISRPGCKLVMRQNTAAAGGRPVRKDVWLKGGRDGGTPTTCSSTCFLSPSSRGVEGLKNWRLLTRARCNGTPSPDADWKFVCTNPCHVSQFELFAASRCKGELLAKAPHTYLRYVLLTCQAVMFVRSDKRRAA